MSILSFVNSITLSNRKLSYPSSATAEERAVQWLIDEDNLNGTTTTTIAAGDEKALRQRYVLATLRFQLPPAEMVPFGQAEHAATWATSLSECDWAGVECDDGTTVTGLQLRIADVPGRLFDDLGLLTTLTYLDLVNNDLTGIIPSTISRLLALTSLELNINKLTGTIPSSLGALTSLIMLDLEDNDLTGTIPSSLGTLTALTDLGFRINALTGTIPSSLAQLTALKDLRLLNNFLTGTVPSSLGTLVGLTNLMLSLNQLTGTLPSSLGALTSLHFLYVQSNLLSGTMPLCTLIDNRTFSNLVADCNEVDCPCCTECCPPGGWNGIPGYTGFCAPFKM
jgi:hypothetical protein